MVPTEIYRKGPITSVLKITQSRWLSADPLKTWVGEHSIGSLSGHCRPFIMKVQKSYDQFKMMKPARLVQSSRRDPILYYGEPQASLVLKCGSRCELWTMFSRLHHFEPVIGFLYWVIWSQWPDSELFRFPAFFALLVWSNS